MTIEYEISAFCIILLQKFHCASMEVLSVYPKQQKYSILKQTNSSFLTSETAKQFQLMLQFAWFVLELSTVSHSLHQYIEFNQLSWKS